MHRPLREAAAKMLASNKEGRTFLREHLDKGDVGVSATALTALIDANDPLLNEFVLHAIVKNSPELGMRERALRDLVARAWRQRQGRWCPSPWRATRKLPRVSDFQTRRG